MAGGKDQTSSGLFGLGDVATGGLFTAGGSLLGGLAGLFRGKSDLEQLQEDMLRQQMAAAGQGSRMRQSAFNLAQNRLGQSVLEPEQYLADYMRSLTPTFNRQAEAVNKRLGLDSGVAQGELARSREFKIADWFWQMKAEGDRLRAVQDNSLIALMAQLGR